MYTLASVPARSLIHALGALQGVPVYGSLSFVHLEIFASSLNLCISPLVAASVRSSWFPPQGPCSDQHNGTCRFRTSPPSVSTPSKETLELKVQVREMFSRYN